eukprot:1158032-Pelagomonas_calceolata.AAC.11
MWSSRPCPQQCNQRTGLEEGHRKGMCLLRMAAITHARCCARCHSHHICRVLCKMPQSSHMQGAVQDATTIKYAGCCTRCHSHHICRVLYKMPQTSHVQGAVQDAIVITQAGCCAGCHRLSPAAYLSASTCPTCPSAATFDIIAGQARSYNSEPCCMSNSFSVTTLIPTHAAIHTFAAVVQIEPGGIPELPTYMSNMPIGRYFDMKGVEFRPARTLGGCRGLMSV